MRKLLTEILLDVTNEAIYGIAKEVWSRARSRCKFETLKIDIGHLVTLPSNMSLAFFAPLACVSVPCESSFCRLSILVNKCAFSHDAISVSRVYWRCIRPTTSILIKLIFVCVLPEAVAAKQFASSSALASIASNLGECSAVSFIIIHLRLSWLRQEWLAMPFSKLTYVGICCVYFSGTFVPSALCNTIFLITNLTIVWRCLIRFLPGWGDEKPVSPLLFVLGLKCIQYDPVITYFWTRVVVNPVCTECKG